MKYYLIAIRHYLNFLSFLAPNFAGKQAVLVFSKVRKKSIRKKEQEFFDQANPFWVEREGENISCYELGNPEGKLLFLVHGWESNPGCFTQFLPHLGKYRIIAFTLPSHAHNKETHTHLYECKDAFKLVLNHVAPTQEFHVVAHSLGSSVATFALSETNYQADKLVFLSANNDMVQVFQDFQKLLGFNNRVFDLIAKRIEKITGTKLAKMTVESRLKQVKFNELLLIHDKYDKIIPFEKSETLSKNVPNSTLIPFERIGHYRMLWNNEVLAEVLKF